MTGPGAKASATARSCATWSVTGSSTCCRQAETLATWLKDHPSVEIVVRDRAGAYGDGARQGAPQAIQVADRWHLLRNSGDALRGVLDHHHRDLDEAARIAAVTVEPAANDNAPGATGDRDVEPPITKAERRSLDARHRREARFDEAVRLRGQGMTLRGIAQALGIGRKTVRRWLRAGHAPTWRHADRGRSSLDPFRDYLEARWAAGYRNGTGLWREIRDRGFAGQSGVVRQWAARRRRQDPPADLTTPTNPPKAQPPTARKAARLLMGEPDKLDEGDRRFVTALLELSPPIAQAVELSKAFSTMIKNGLADQLDGWISAAETGGFKGFARSLRQDRDAVHAALTLPWSTVGRGTDQPVEGHQAVHVRSCRIRPSAPQSARRRIGENPALNFFQKLCTQKNEEPFLITDSNDRTARPCYS